MDAANFLSVRQRRSNPLPMEEERLVEDRLIGQELVPIIPMTPAAELSVDSGALEVNEGSVGSRPNGGPHPLGAEGDDSRHRGGDQQVRDWLQFLTVKVMEAEEYTIKSYH